jgi:hypothetical protein
MHAYTAAWGNRVFSDLTDGGQEKRVSQLIHGSLERKKIHSILKSKSVNLKCPFQAKRNAFIQQTAMKSEAVFCRRCAGLNWITLLLTGLVANVWAKSMTSQRCVLSAARYQDKAAILRFRLQQRSLKHSFDRK